MKSIASGIGIDVSKGRLGVKVPGSKAFAVSNGSSSFCVGSWF